MTTPRRFLIIFKDGTRHPKQVVLDLLEEIDGQYVCDARPYAGTQKIRVDDVLKMIATDAPISPKPRRFVRV